MLRDFLKGLEARAPQSVANMCIIPLVAQGTQYNDVGTVKDIFLERDLAYDRLQMSSVADHPTIMPAGFTLITKEAAQDRSVANKTLIAKKQNVEVNAYCVQSSQCGHMHKGNKEKQQIRMLPVTLRKAAYTHRNERNFSALWGSLDKYNSALGVKGNFLAHFFDNLKDQLDQFIAEFELVPHQRGAIILINDEVVGIELSPNPLAWSEQWESLIRDCYGSEAISSQKEFKVVDESAVFGDVATLEELSERLDDMEEKESEFSERCVADVLAQQEQCTVRQSVDGFSVLDMETPDYIGQVVKKNDVMIDLTLLRRDAAERGFKFQSRRK